MINNEEQLYKERTSKLVMIMLRMLTKENFELRIIELQLLLNKKN